LEVVSCLVCSTPNIYKKIQLPSPLFCDFFGLKDLGWSCIFRGVCRSLDGKQQCVQEKTKGARGPEHVTSLTSVA
jgi:hypothetical protein